MLIGAAHYRNSGIAPDQLIATLNGDTPDLERILGIFDDTATFRGVPPVKCPIVAVYLQTASRQFME